MRKSLPPQTADALNPPANVRFPYRFFEHVDANPFQPNDRSMNLRNAWWLADAALLAYSDQTAIRQAFADAAIDAHVEHFASSLSTQGYVVSLPDANVLVFRGTEVNSFWASVLDFAVDVQFLPIADSHGDLVHSGFVNALDLVWADVRRHLLAEQARTRRPLWLAGHSLGAALALHAASRCADEPALGLAGVYTFGSPRAGDRSFGTRLGVPVFRFRNDSDIVPHLPLGVLYRHVGELQFLDGAGRLHRRVPGPLEAILDPGASLLSAREAAAIRDFLRTPGASTLPLPPILADHAPINYSILLWNAHLDSPGERA